MRRRDVGVEGDPLSGNCRSGQVEHPLPSPLAVRTPNPHSITRRGGDDLAGVVEHPPYGGSGTGASSPSSGSKASTAPSNHTYVFQISFALSLTAKSANRFLIDRRSGACRMTGETGTSTSVVRLRDLVARG